MKKHHLITNQIQNKTKIYKIKTRHILQVIQSENKCTDLNINLHHTHHRSHTHLEVILFLEVIDDVWLPEVSVCLCFLQWEPFGVEADETVAQRPLVNRFLGGGHKGGVTKLYCQNT